jgi:hypothetical protein
MNFYFVYDEYTDIADEHAASAMAQSVLNVMKKPGAELDASDHLLAKMTREYVSSDKLCRTCGLKISNRFCIRSATLTPLSSSCFKRFLRTSEAYFHAVTGEARFRATNYTPSFIEYMPFRRDTCGARPTLVLTEFGLDLPDYVTSHPVMSALMEDAVDLIIFVNVRRASSRCHWREKTDLYLTLCFT